jgi:hypothetical protein
VSRIGLPHGPQSGRANMASGRRNSFMTYPPCDSEPLAGLFVKQVRLLWLTPAARPGPRLPAATREVY